MAKRPYKRRAKFSVIATSHEIRFIKDLGNHRAGQGGVTWTPRKILLQRYIDAWKDRDWGNIDKKAVLKFAKLSLKMEG